MYLLIHVYLILYYYIHSELTCINEEFTSEKPVDEVC